MVLEKNIGPLEVRIYESRKLLGEAAAKRLAESIALLLKEKEELNIIFAAAPSQNEFLAALSHENIRWDCVNAFHMDEYVGLDEHAPQRFGNFLKEALFSKFNFRSVHYLNGNAEDVESECMRYSSLLEDFPADIVCLGIGENGHLAFNDPPVADFNDPKLVKVVELDLPCRQQQVNDGCFSRLEQVPTHALTLTIPVLMHAKLINCVVPGSRKAQAVAHTLRKPVAEDFPATVLRKHAGTVIFLDSDSAEHIYAELKFLCNQ
ncbi:glucosamine-6-phosphate deaminase [Pedobacter sp. AW31-3R]|uniref:glucosamine-6-phosphate deaminase n=1 Tax=Pedobacter sp. AW31-3R TaxID=3445781 RepID=UPI003FA0A68B